MNTGTLIKTKDGQKLMVLDTRENGVMDCYNESTEEFSLISAYEIADVCGCCTDEYVSNYNI